MRRRLLEVADSNWSYPLMEAKDIYRESLRHFLAPIRPLLDDPDVSEVLINGPKLVYFESRGRIQCSDLQFPSDAALMAAVRNIAEFVGRQIDEDHHSMDARLPDGSRVHVIIPPSAREGIHVSIRKFLRSAASLAQLVQLGSLTEEAAEFLEFVVLLHKNCVISGGTGTGKTSMLNALSASIPEHERIVVIEDSSELRLDQPHTVYLEAQPARPNGKGEVTIRDLFIDSLRMRPDRIVMGEVRRGEALDMIQAMISGHAGALTTVHANTALDALTRLETLCLMAGVDLPVYVARTQVASAIHIIVQLVRLDDGTRRVQSISEAGGLAGQTYRVRDLFRLETLGRDARGRIRGQLVFTGERPSFAAEPKQLGLTDRMRHSVRVFEGG